MSVRWWRRVDAVAHFLHCPAMAGKRMTRHTRLHDVHLIPGWLLERVCDRLDMACGLTREDMDRR
ncbi:hypothetical protein ACFWYW_59180 [Nonomuraea sp. NPDC059023]|uniref:hypothetical protein n=1 Tax=unclassified Nonomuraea TaxID=2593643 RepID=UPI0036CDD33F